MLKLVSRIFRLLVAAFILGNLVYVFIDNIVRTQMWFAARPIENYRRCHHDVLIHPEGTFGVEGIFGALEGAL
jgi:hypothetical protein